MSFVTEEVLLASVANDFGLEPKDVEIVSFEKSSGSKFGDGFACELWRVDVKAKVKGEVKELSYMAKGPHENHMMEKVIEKSGIIDREVWFYNCLSEKLQKIRKDANLPPLKLAKCLYTDLKSGLIVLENLKVKNFGLINKSAEGISNEGVEMFLKELAEYHATTYHYLQTNGGKEALLKKHPFLKAKSFFDFVPDMVDMQKRNFDQILSMAATFIKNDGDEELSDKVMQQVGIFYEKFNKATVLEENSNFETITHGDFWYNNIMVKYNEKEELVDCKLIDFQIMMINSVVVDIQYFLAASANMEAKQTMLKKWLALYHQKLTACLVTYGYKEDLYPFYVFLEDFKKGYYHAFIMGLFHCQLHVIGLKDSGIDENAMKGGEKTPEEIEQMTKDFMKSILENAHKVPGLVQRYVSIAKEAQEYGCI